MKHIDSSKLPKATHTGKIRLEDLTISCAVLEDGRRVLTQADYLQALGRSPRPKGLKSFADTTATTTVDQKNSFRDKNKSKPYVYSKLAASTTVDHTPAFLRAKSLQPFISKDLAASTIPIRFTQPSGGIALGFLAETLPQVCVVFLDAFEADALSSRQQRTAEQAYMIVRALAQTGIIALVDEATQYQAERAPDALQDAFGTFLRREAATWTRRFPDAFYEEMYRLLNWEWQGMSVRRPWEVGKHTNDLIYSRLAPGILRELEERNPANENGNRKARHHQFLTHSQGHPALGKHLHAVIGLMKAAETWKQFYGMMERVFPRYNAAGELEGGRVVSIADVG